MGGFPHRQRLFAFLFQNFSDLAVKHGFQRFFKEVKQASWLWRTQMQTNQDSAGG